MTAVGRKVALWAIASAVVVGCDDPPSDPAIGVAAYVEGSPVYVDEVEHYLDSNLVMDETMEDLAPGILDEIKSRLFDAMLEERMLLAEAGRRGIEVGPLEVTAYLELETSIDDEEDTDSRHLRQTEARQRLMVQKLQETIIRERPPLTDDEVATYAVDHRKTLLPAEPVELRALQLGSLKQADRIYKEIRRKRMTFNEATLAYERSPGQALPTRMSWESLPDELRATLEELKPGQVSKPLELHGEIYLFHVGKWLSDPADHDAELLLRARSRLESERNRNSLDALMDDLRNRANIRIKKSNLSFDYVPAEGDPIARWVDS
ncbi:MAG TPA: peptidylprolyl isomerase [Candidatus Polarisedimenticolaceae bacterium]|nr:peptidylprolyl isomerase [Candidatus Polarisedimenticolaceae bacterium]